MQSSNSASMISTALQSMYWINASSSSISRVRPLTKQRNELCFSFAQLSNYPSSKRTKHHFTSLRAPSIVDLKIRYSGFQWLFFYLTSLAFLPWSSISKGSPHIIFFCFAKNSCKTLLRLETYRMSICFGHWIVKCIILSLLEICTSWHTMFSSLPVMCPRVAAFSVIISALSFPSWYRNICEASLAQFKYMFLLMRNFNLHLFNYRLSWFLLLSSQ